MFSRRELVIGGLLNTEINTKVYADNLKGNVSFIYGGRILPFTFPGVIYQAQQSCIQAFPNLNFSYLDSVDSHLESAERLSEFLYTSKTGLAFITSSSTLPVLAKIIDRHPNVFFVISGGITYSRKNVLGYTVRWYEQSYIIGYLMGLLSNSSYVALQSDGIRADHTTYSFVNGAAIGAWAAGKRLHVYRSDRSPANNLFLSDTMKLDKPNVLIVLNDNGVILNHTLSMFPNIKVAAMPAEKAIRRIAPNNLLAFTGVNIESFFIETVEKWKDGNIRPGEITLGFEQNVHSFDFFPLIQPDVLSRVKHRVKDLDVEGEAIVNPRIVTSGLTLEKSISLTTVEELKAMKLWEEIIVRFGEFKEIRTKL